MDAGKKTGGSPGRSRKESVWKRLCCSNDFPKWKNGVALVFLLASASLLIFGIAAQVLCEAMGYDRGLLRYLLGLVPAGLSFFLMYWGVYYFDVGGSLFRFLAALLVMAVLVWSVFMALVLTAVHVRKDPFITYKFCAWTDPRREVRYMLSKSRPFGRGDPYYVYEEGLLEGYVPHRDDLPREVSLAFDERLRAEEVFSGYRQVRTLPVLSYHYGLVVNYIFAFLAGLWCLAAAVAWLQVYRWWEKVLYLVCGLVVALQLMLSLLGAFGILPDLCWYPFSGSWFFSLTLSAPQLAIMLALLKISQPAPDRMLVLGVDFEDEILEEF